MSKFNCSSCGSSNFIIQETLVHKAEVDNKGNLSVYKGDGGIDSIECAECGQRFSEGWFKRIDF